MLRKREDEFSVQPGSGKAVEALADRVELLAGMVRDAVGGITATKGDIAALDRRLTERLEAESARAAGALEGLRRELKTLHGRLPERGAALVDSKKDSAEIQNSVSALAQRVDTLAGIVRDATGRISASEGAAAGIKDLKELIVSGDQRVMDAVAEVRSQLGSVSALAERAAEQAARVTVDADLPQRLEQKLEALANRLDVVSSSVGDTASKVLKERSKIEHRVSSVEQTLEQRAAGVGHTIEGLKTDIERLARTIDDDPGGRKRVDSLADAVSALKDRLDTVSGIVRESLGGSPNSAEAGAFAAGLTELEDRVAGLAGALRTEIAEVSQAVSKQAVAPEQLTSLEDHVHDLAMQFTRLESSLAVVNEVVTEATGKLGVELRTEMQESVSSLRTDIAELAGRPSEDVAARERLDVLAGWVDALRGRLDSVTESALAVNGAGTDTGAELLAELDRRVGGLADELREEITALSSAAVAEPARLAQLEQQVQELSGQLSGLEGGALTEDVLERIGAQLRTHIGGSVHELAERLEQIERDRQAVAAEAEAAERAWVEERVALEARLDVIASAVSEHTALGPDVQQLLNELGLRLERMEHQRAAAADLAALADTWRAELHSLEARLSDELTAVSARASDGAGDPQDEVLEELRARIDRMESDRDAVSAELARTSDAWMAERAALQERVSELAARIVTGPVGTGMEPGLGSDAEVEFDQLRIGIEGLRMRLAYHEKAVAEVASRGVLERLEELTARLDRLQTMVTQTAMAGSPVATSFSPTADVKVLLTRMERAEEDVRHTQEAFVDQMERMASRLDFRLHQLEANSS